MKSKSEETCAAFADQLLDAILRAEQEVVGLTYELSQFNDRKTMVQTEIIGECYPLADMAVNPSPAVWRRMWADLRWIDVDADVRNVRKALDGATVRLRDLERRLHYAQVSRYTGTADEMVRLARQAVDEEVERLARSAQPNVAVPSL